jgi:hypothetical protein
MTLPAFHCCWAVTSSVEDNEITWFDWSKVDHKLLQFTKNLIALLAVRIVVAPLGAKAAASPGKSTLSDAPQDIHVTALRPPSFPPASLSDWQGGCGPALVHTGGYRDDGRELG